jgi:hypothetical protein
MFFNELDGCFNNDVVEKMFHKSSSGILCVKIATWFLSDEGLKPSANEVPTNHADFADQFFQPVTLPPALPAVRPGILLRLLFDFLGVGLFEECCQLSAELREMIK